MLLLTAMWMQCVESCSVQSADLELLEQETDRNRKILAELESQPVSHLMSALFTGCLIYLGHIARTLG